MERVTFDGVDYVKASVAAKQFNYTSDYIGQLCRSKKIDARLVGRTWFVNIDSIVEHRNNKHAKQKSLKKEKTSSGSTKTKTEVAPVIKSKTLKSLISSDVSAEGNDLERKLKVSYELDEEALLPTIEKKHYKAPTSIKIEHVDAKKIKIHGSKSNKSETSYVPNELPDVALSGKLSVEGLAEEENKKEDEKETESEKTYENKTKIDTSTKTTTKKVVLKPTKYSSIKSNKLSKKAEVFHNETIDESAGKTATEKEAHTPEKPRKIEFAPKLLKDRDVVLSSYPSEGSIEMPENEPVSSWVLVSPLIATFVAVAVVTLLMSASTEIEISDTGYQSNILIQTANLFDLFAG